MPNFRYKIANEDIIVSSEEHLKIQEARKSGATHLSLRGGRMGVNLAYCQFWKETEQPTEPQLEEREKSLKLEQGKIEKEPNPVFSEKVRDGKAELYEKLGWK